MKAPIANLINAIVLIAISAWAYLGSDTPSFTALIPAGFGVCLLMCQPGVKRESKIITYIAVVLSVLVMLALLKPMSGAVGRGDVPVMMRVGVMMMAGLLAIIALLRNFIAAEKTQRG